MYKCGTPIRKTVSSDAAVSKDEAFIGEVDVASMIGMSGARHRKHASVGIVIKDGQEGWEAHDGRDRCTRRNRRVRGVATVATLGKNSEPPKGEGLAEEGGFSLFKRDVVDNAADKARCESRGGGAAEER